MTKWDIWLILFQYLTFPFVYKILNKWIDEADYDIERLLYALILIADAIILLWGLPVMYEYFS